MTLYDSLDKSLRDSITEHLGKAKSPFAIDVISDYWTGLVSRELSVQGRREVLTGKAKFGIFGDGKELPQLAMARTFKKGDYRAGYYRDQTLMLALGVSSVEDFLSQMYSDAAHDPFSGGRQMAAHFATPFIDENDEWLDLSQQINMTSGISCTGGQMGRAIGLAFASKKYRELNLGKEAQKFSDKGNEVCFCTIGDASTSEGVFWETVNAAAVLQIPLVLAVWDDGYGISVPTSLQTAKGSISKALKGFVKKKKDQNGIALYKVDGWDYPELCVTFDEAVAKARKEHIPVVIHVKNLTQPQGHSTSGSHERYKSKERLSWENDLDGLRKMEEWLLSLDFITADIANNLKREARSYVREKKQLSWNRFQDPNNEAYESYVNCLAALPNEVKSNVAVAKWIVEVNEMVNPTKSEILSNARQIHFCLRSMNIEIPSELSETLIGISHELKRNYSTHLYSSSGNAAINIPVVPPIYSEDSLVKNGYEVINTFFDKAFEKNKMLIAFGEDVGHIGDVNQGMAGLQKKFGKERIFDTGIREWTIIGQGLGAAMRGLRPIAEIQYLDYLVYALPVLTDDLATLRYRSNNLQQAPMILRTRGHRLEGIWHTGSPMGMMLNSLQGIYLLTPRNMVQAAGMYNTMIQSNDPAIIVECLNGYRLKEKMPDNIGEYTVPIGMVETLQEGSDVTIVTYGSCVRVAMQAILTLQQFGISVELIDAQTLIPFDMEKSILESLKKTNKILFLDEDVPGGASSYMMQKVLEEQGGFKYLDAEPITLCAKEHRTPYGSDGDYYAKPQVEDVVQCVYELVFEEEYF